MFPSRSVVAIWRSLSAEDVAIQDPPDAVSVDRIIEKIDHCSPPRNIHVPSASPRDPLLGGSSHRKHAVPNCNGPARNGYSALSYNLSSFTSRKVPKNNLAGSTSIA